MAAAGGTTPEPLANAECRMRNAEWPSTLHLVFCSAGSYAGAALAGELYGVHWAPDSLASTESTVGGYTLFPDINRVEWHSFMALGDE